MSSPIQVQQQINVIHNEQEEQEETEPEVELGINAPIISETTDLGFTDQLYQETVDNYTDFDNYRNCDHYESIYDESLTNFGSIEYCDDFFSL